MKTINKEIIMVTILLLFTGVSLISAGIDDIKWPVCEAVNVTGSECDTFWNGLNLTDANLTDINITVNYYNETFVNETNYDYTNNTYNYDNSSFFNLTYNKTEIDEKITTLDNKIIATPSNVNLNPYVLKTDLSGYSSTQWVSAEINRSLNNYSGLSTTWEWTIILNWMVSFGIIIGIVIIMRME